MMECAAATNKNTSSTNRHEFTGMKIIRDDSRDSRIVPGFGFLALLAFLAVKLFCVMEDVAATNKNTSSTNEHESTWRSEAATKKTEPQMHTDSH
jgi:hypothetical protein